MEKIKNGDIKLPEALRRFLEEYGFCGALCCAAVVLKFVLFYELMDITAHLPEVLLTSLFFVFLLFKSFKNKWIPAVIYLLLSALMFCDAMYFNHFNSYLSVRMLGAAGVLGDIGDSIKQILSLRHIALFFDSALIFLALAIKRYEGVNAANRGNAGSFFIDRGEWLKNLDTTRLFSAKTYRPLLVFALVLTLICANPFSSDTATAVSNQELLSFHVKDIVQNGILRERDRGSLEAFRGNYEEEKNSPLFGAAEGRNLIVIQLESFQNFVVGMEYEGQEVTPVLNSLIRDDSIYFDNFYHQTGSGNTSDAEFAVNNSIHGSLMSYTYKIYENNYFRGLPILLGERGYDSAVFHAYDDRTFWNREAMYPKQGFRRYYGGFRLGESEGDYEYGDWVGWGLADHDFFKQSAEFMTELKQPFYAMLISLSNHHPFDVPERFARLELKAQDKGTIVGNYLQGCAYTDYALGVFIEELKKEGLYENSLIAIYGDHVGLTHETAVDAQMKRLLGHKYDYDDMMKIPLVLHMPGIDFRPESEEESGLTIHTAGGQLDFMPTVACLLGMEELDTIYLGNNLLTEGEGFVAIETYMPRGSFVKGDIMFEMSRDGIFGNSRVWNMLTDEELDPKDFEDDSKRATEIMESSDFILESDALRLIFEDGLSAETAGGVRVERAAPEEIYVAGYPDSSLMGTNSIEALDYSYGNNNYKAKSILVELSMEKAEHGGGLAPLFKSGRRLGVEPMSAEELAEWMQKHGAVNIVAKVDGDGGAFVEYMNRINGTLGDRIILEVSSFGDYNKYDDAIICFDEAIEELTEDGRLSMLPALELIKEPWAISFENERQARVYGYYAGGSGHRYIYDSKGIYELQKDGEEEKPGKSGESEREKG